MRARDLFDAGLRLVGGRRFVEGDYLKAVESFEQSRDLFRRLGDEPEAGVAEVWALQLLPDVGRLEKAKTRLASLAADAERRRYNVLLPAAHYWLGVCDYRGGNLSQTSRDQRTALRLAEAADNTFEAAHAREALASYYWELGELEPALSYASGMLNSEDAYYRNPRQVWRDLGTLSDIALKLNLPAASLDFAEERLKLAAEISPDTTFVKWSLRNAVNAADAKGDFAGALAYSGESLRLALGGGDKPENARTAAELYLSRDDLKNRARDCEGALEDYGRALELYGRLPEVSASAYQIHKGRLLCFRQLGRRADFESELQAVLKLSEEYRVKIREDDSRQAFFANEQGVFDAAAEYALEASDARSAFGFVEKSRARSLL